MSRSCFAFWNALEESLTSAERFLWFCRTEEAAQMATTQVEDQKDMSLELKFYAFYVNDMVRSRSGLAARPAFFSNYMQDLHLSEDQAQNNNAENSTPTSHSPALPRHL